MASNGKTASKKKPTKDEKTSLPKTDIYRDTALRYLGYAGSLSWICRAFIPFQVASMVSVAYVCADIFDKANASAKRRDSENQVLTTAADAFTWHFFSTFALPGVVISGITGLASKLRAKNRPHLVVLPCVLSGMALPFISKPIDEAVDYMMQTILRYQHKFHGDDQLEECTCDSKVDMEGCENDLKGIKSNKYSWFFEQSREQQAIELERYREKLKAQARNQGPPSSPGGDGTAAGVQPSRQGDSTADRIRTDDFNRRGFGTEALAPELPDAGLQDETTSARQQQEAGPSSAAGAVNDDDENGLLDKAIQVDKTTKPPKPPKPAPE